MKLIRTDADIGRIYTRGHLRRLNVSRIKRFKVAMRLNDALNRSLSRLRRLRPLV